MEKPLILSLATLSIAFLTVGTAQAQCVATADGSSVQCQALLAGQTVDAGTVCVEVGDENLVITYATANGWELVETHTWVGDSLSKMPQTKKGNPIPGNFPYKSGDISGATSYVVTIPLAILNFVCPTDDKMYYVAAHAALRKLTSTGGYQTETGWADGDRFVEQGNWGTFFTITLTCECGGGEGETECETAFAFDANGACFLDLDLNNDGKQDFNRWGWSIGPLSEGTYVYDVYAGAGQCDITKGMVVGTAYVTYESGKATVIIDTVSPYFMDEAHLYVGNDILPVNGGEYTVAPGQYPYILDLTEATTATFAVEGLTGEVYVVLHAVTCVRVQ